MRVRVTRLNSTAGMMISAESLARRREGVAGTLWGYVPGHGGDVWWVVYDGCPKTTNAAGEAVYDKSGVAPFGTDELDVDPEWQRANPTDPA